MATKAVFRPLNEMLILGTLAILTPAAGYCGPAGPAATPIEKQGKVQSIPASDRRIIWEVLRADGTRLVFAGKDGEMVRVKEQDGSILGLTPLVNDAQAGQVRVSLYRIIPVDREHEMARQLGAVELPSGKEQPVEFGRGFTARLLRVVLPDSHSSDVVKWELTLPDGTEASFESPDGTMSKFKDTRKGFALGFVPTIENRDRGIVRFQVVAVKSGTSQPIESLRASGDKEATASVAVPGLKIRVTGIQPSDGLKR
ncbi:MAG: hypothetical protein M3O15_09465 [Acidobacteriota bacterium]|nr:hypothetical protein [Acidobacteriota bacterium]